MSQSHPMIPIDFVFFDAGGGHRAAATALRRVAAERYPDWDIRMVQLQDALEPIDIFRKWFGIRMEDVYNQLLKRGWTLGSTQMLPLMHVLIRMFQGPCVRMLEKHWQESRPRLVVSLIPNFNRALYLSLTRTLPDVPLVTILTDFADYPPHFWIEEDQDQYFICGTEKAAQQALALGHPGSRVIRTSGMILRPEFYGDWASDKRSARIELGLAPDRATGLVLFGGYGSPGMKEITHRIAATGKAVQLILICGRNEKLKKTLESTPFDIPVHVEGFTNEIPRFMAMADFFIGKPGPGSVSEALVMNLPVIVERNAWTLPQERYNADWVQEKGVGLVVKNFREIGDVVERLLADLKEYQARAKALQNYAVFEIPDILDRILAKHTPAAVSPGAIRRRA